MDYCEKVQSELKRLGIRANIDERNEKLGYKIRESQMQKIPYMLVLGDQEVNEKAVNVRQFGHQKSEQVPFQVFKENIVKQVKNRSM